MTIERSGPGKQKIDTNFMRVLERHANDVMHLIHIQRPLKLLYEVMNREGVKESFGDTGSKFIMQWLDLIAKDGGVSGSKSIALLDTLRRNTQAAMIPFRLPTALVHGTKFIYTAAYFGGPEAVDGMAKMLDPTWKKFIWDNFPDWRHMQGDDPSYEISDAKGWMDSYQHYGYAVLRELNSMSSGGALITAYKSKLAELGLPIDLKKPNAEAISHASLFMRRAQDDPHYRHLPPVMSIGTGIGDRSVARFVTQLQLFMFNRWSMIEHDLFRAGIDGPGVNKKNARMLAYLLAANAADAGIRVGVHNSWMWLLGATGATVAPYVLRKHQEFIKRFEEEMLRNIPYFPLLSRSAFDGKLSVPGLDPLAHIGAAAHEVIKNDNWGKAIMESVEALAELTCTGGVAPIIELARMMENNRMTFPWADELHTLRQHKKSGIMTNVEGQRYKALEAMNRVFNKEAKIFKDEMKHGRKEEAKKASDRMVHSVKMMKDGLGEPR